MYCFGPLFVFSASGFCRNKGTVGVQYQIAVRQRSQVFGANAGLQSNQIKQATRCWVHAELRAIRRLHFDSMMKFPCHFERTTRRTQARL